MKRRFWLVLLLAVLVLCSLCVGRYGSSLSDIGRALLFSGDALTRSLVWNLRMPRILLVCISGAALAVSGVVYQTIFRNPLASGDVIGASSGCSLGAVFAILVYQEAWFVELCAFLMGMMLVILTFFMASRIRGKSDFKPGGCRTHSAGGCDFPHDDDEIICGSCDTAGQYGILADGRLFRCFLAFGSYHPCIMFLWNDRTVSVTLADSAVSVWRGSEYAGVNTKVIRWTSLLLATLLISSVISVAGIVSWVSLLIPHIIRIAVKKPVSQTMGITAISGAIFLLVCDTLARTLLTIEIPISILTSLFGALVLIVLFMKGRLHV